MAAVASSSSTTVLIHLLFCFNALLLQCPLSRGVTLESVRDFLTREEDTIVFSLIERAKYPYNSPLYSPSSCLKVDEWVGNSCSLVELFVRDSERVQAKFGSYQNPEEVPFFPDEDLTWPVVPPYNFSKVLYPAAASVNVSDTIWNVYFKELLPQFTVEGVDGNFASTAASDLVCLQALSRRIHYGRFVAEVKFRDSPQDYIPAIRAKDRDSLMQLVTSESQEEIVKKRVEKKAAVFGQDVTLDRPADTGDSNSSRAAYKVDPSVVYRLYGDWVIPLTKIVEIEYLLRRLD